MRYKVLQLAVKFEKPLHLEDFKARDISIVAKFTKVNIWK
jgi:hypothetical protein